MLKYKVIRAYIAVWCVVCLAYIGVRTTLGAALNGPTTTSESTPESSLVAEPAEQVVTDSKISQEGETLAAHDDATETTAQTSTEPTGQGASEDVVSPGGAIVDSTATSANSTSTPADNTNAEANDVEDWSQEIEAAEIPSLDEYLSWYTCGSCRRNCSLANPRCHNGSRLAEAKAQEYYEIYG